MKKIVFHDNSLCMRGTTVAMYDYAKYNQEILGNKSIVLCSPHANLDAYPKFKNSFETHLMDFGNYEKFCLENEIDYLYAIKGGGNDGLCLSQTPTLVHAVFCVNEPHGYKYFYVSDWLAKNQGYSPETHSLPHIVKKYDGPIFDMREKLGIPKNKIVLGYYGGKTEFNITFVHDIIKRIVNERNDIVFIFMNVNRFSEPHKNIIHLPASWDLSVKASFVHACDGMIHARSGGETFGCAVAEFAIENKPVITYSHSGERNHIEHLGERGIYYGNYEELYNILNNFTDYKKYDDYYVSYDSCSPEIIMQKFNKLIS
jgi:hypothetical protein